MVEGRPLVGSPAHHGVTQAGRLLPTQWENGVLRPRQQHQQYPQHQQSQYPWPRGCSWSTATDTPLMPCHPARARKLLRSGRARTCHRAPFVIRLVDREAKESEVPGVELGLDPGSKKTGVSVFQSTPAGRVGLCSFELEHRGQHIRKKMGQRAGYRRRRRTVNLRYRKPRWANRHPEACASCGRNARHGSRYCRPCGGARDFADNGQRRTRLAPSLRHRVDNTMSMLTRLSRWAPVVGVHLELVRFDTQQMENPEVSGVEYQQGTLAGFEVREYLLAK
ncbi:MAG: RRXRR domain-containing protein, partial [Acidimicrobiales bacterium]